MFRDELGGGLFQPTCLACAISSLVFVFPILTRCKLQKQRPTYSLRAASTSLHAGYQPREGTSKAQWLQNTLLIIE